MEYLKADLLAALTVAIVLLPQGVAFSLIAELPPQTGLYAAIVASIAGALWGSSAHLHIGPTNAASLLVLTALLPLAEPGSPRYIAAAGLMAVMVGLFQIAIGVSRLGILVNFVSDSVIIGFSAGAGVLIGVNQLASLLRLDFPSSSSLIATIRQLAAHISETHLLSLLFGLATIIILGLLRRLKPNWPGALFVLVLSTGLVGILNLEAQGLKVIGELPRSLPPLAKLPLTDFNLITDLLPGVFAASSIGLVQAIAISRSISSQSGQKIDSNQEFIGQGLANLFSGIFSGYHVSASFNRSAINYDSGAHSSLASLFSGVFVLIIMLVLAPWAVYLPRAVLAGVLVSIAYGMIDKGKIIRIIRGAPGDTVIMIVTFLATLLLPLQFAVLTGILLSFAVYILRTSVPRVIPVLPADNFRHFLPQGDREACPQLSIIDIYGDLYFGAVSHVEETLQKTLEQNPRQRFMLLRMFSVNQVDISGVHALESITRTLRERGGDLYMMRTQKPIIDLMKSIGFYDFLGEDNFLPYDKAIAYIFQRVLDPAICIYECDVRAFLECQNLPKPGKLPGERALPKPVLEGQIKGLDASDLWARLHQPNPPKIVDVREPREFRRGHIMGAESIPLIKLLTDTAQVSKDQQTVFVCRSGRRSTRATYFLNQHGFKNVQILNGGMLAWEAAGLLEAVDD